MAKKLTVTVSDRFYETLRKRAGSGGVGRYLGDLASPVLEEFDLASEYREASQDQRAEIEASEWLEANLDVKPPAEDWAWLRDAAR